MGKKAGSALLLIDVINGFDFPGASALVRAAKRVAPSISRLADLARTSDVPVIYVNDNFGRWTSDFKGTVRECARSGRAGRLVVEYLRPKNGDYFVLKPQHSGFYGTPLSLLLDHLGAHTLVLAGFATDICVLFTANDAHMRGYHLVVPSDCVAANTSHLNRSALRHVRTVLSGATPSSKTFSFEALRDRHKKPRGQTF